MKKYLHIILSVMLLVLVGCNGGLDIKEQITGNLFTIPEQKILQDFINKETEDNKDVYTVTSDEVTSEKFIFEGKYLVASGEFQKDDVFSIKVVKDKGMFTYTLSKNNIEIKKNYSTDLKVLIFGESNEIVPYKSNSNFSEAKYAVDSDLSTKWSSIGEVASTGNPVEFSIDLGKEITLGNIVMNVGEYKHSIELYISKDGVNWISAQYGTSMQNKEIYWDVAGIPGTWRYIKATFDYSEDNGVVHIYEFSAKEPMVYVFDSTGNQLYLPAIFEKYGDNDNAYFIKNSNGSKGQMVKKTEFKGINKEGNNMWLVTEYDLKGKVTATHDYNGKGYLTIRYNFYGLIYVNGNFENLPVLIEEYDSQYDNEGAREIFFRKKIDGTKGIVAMRNEKGRSIFYKEDGTEAKLSDLQGRISYTDSEYNELKLMVESEIKREEDVVLVSFMREGLNIKGIIQYDTLDGETIQDEIVFIKTETVYGLYYSVKGVLVKTQLFYNFEELKELFQ